MSEVPTLCALCLGDKKHLKMVRQPQGEQCKLCTRPFTVFRWNSSEVRNKSNKTILCKTCATARNCCQSCMVDVDYGIPIDIRDAALKMAHVENPYAVNITSRNSEVRAIMADKMDAKTRDLVSDNEAEKRAKAKAILEALQVKLTGDGAKTSRLKVKAADASSKEIAKTVSKLPFGGTLSVPEDTSVKSFFVFGFSPDLPQYELSAHFEKFGPVASVKLVHHARCGYVTYSTRSSAEAFAEAAKSGLSKNPKTAGLISIGKSELVRVSWGVPRPLGNTKDENSKLSQVVIKVMKQLAEKDENSKKDRKNGSSNVSSKPEPTPSYKALAKDVEL